MRLMMLVTACLAFGCKDSHKRNDPLVELARTCTHDAELSCPRPIFNVRSLRASQAYFHDALGFKLDWDHGDPPDFGSVSRGDSQIFMCQGCQGTPGAWTMIFAKDVDALHQDFVRRKAQIRMPPTNMPWGIREMHVSDLDGNVLRFGSSIDPH